LLIRIEAIDRSLGSTAAWTPENVGRLGSTAAWTPENVGRMLDDWNSLNAGIDAVLGKGHRLVVRTAPIAALLERPAAAAATGPAPEQVAAIVALSKKVNYLVDSPATVPVSAIVLAPESQDLAALTKQVTAVSLQLTSGTAHHATISSASFRVISRGSTRATHRRTPHRRPARRGAQ
jgi:hypothetical protein